MNYTREQEEAIYTKNQDILVSAGAGAGKTRVLVTRISEMIMDTENPISADQILVLTFTNAAAREMKERITDELEQRLEKNPDNRRLRQQIRIVKHADISTVHSFCNHLIRTHFNELGLDPSFRIGETGELEAMKQEVMEELLEKYYEESSEDFLRLVEAYAPGRDDNSIENIILGIYDFSRSFPDVSGWFRSIEKDFISMTKEESLEDSPAIEQILSTAKSKINNLADYIDEVMPLFDGGAEQGRVLEVLKYDEKLIHSLKKAESFQEIYDLLHEVKFLKYPLGKKEEKAWQYFENMKAAHVHIKSVIEELAGSHFLKSISQVRIEQKALYPYLKEFIILVEEFADKFMQKKKDKNIFDFNDLEHFALRLLVEEYKEDGSQVPTKMAEEIAGRYRAIFVDEYQDTNLVQETIITTLLNSGKSNLFAVGDVKQSIYGFRQARPDLFLERYHNYENGLGLKIELRDNFRSSPDVLDFCNLFFKRFMRTDFGGIDYNENVCLRAGENGPMYHVHESQEALLYTYDGEEDQLDKTLGEAIMIGRRIEDLLEEGYQYEDMVILLRSVKNYSQIIAEYLESRNIPVICESQMGYFQTREIRVMLNYLAVIDNVYQDIPMASVMLSSIGGFDIRDLALLKVLVDGSLRKEYTLYDLMKLYIREGTEEKCKEKIERFLRQLEEFREKKQEMLLHELIWDIYKKTGFYEEVLSMPHGKKRRENLMMLLKKAEEYEKTILKGLFYFIRYMEELRTYEVEPGGKSAADSVEKAVKIMTIHKSKGLEFPVVFLSTLSKQFNKMDLNESVLYHPEFGIGMDIIDMDRRLKNLSVLKTVIREKKLKELKEEELRILYVAMTRAQKKLILTGTKSLKKIEEFEENGGSHMMPDEAKCLLDWILPVLYHDGSWNNLKKVTSNDLNEWVTGIQKQKEPHSLVDLFDSSKMKNVDAGVVKKAFHWKYAHEECIDWKRKYSVSELKKLAMQSLPDEEIPTWEIPIFEEEEVLKPAFLLEETEEISGTAYGTMVHKIMELLPFEQIHSEKNLFDQLEILWNLYPDINISIRKKIYLGVKEFLFSENGKILVDMAKEGHLYKELPFTIGLDASLLYPETSGGETVVVQGIIDLCGEKENELWLLDYKTDRIQIGEESVLLDRYKEQMLYYKLALEQMMQKKVKHCLIYSFALRTFLELKW